MATPALLGSGAALGAAGANVGTRFLASEEAGANGAWKELILDSESEDAVRFETWQAIMPSSGSGYASRRA